MKNWLITAIIVKIFLIAGYIELKADIPTGGYDHGWHVVKDESVDPWDPNPENMLVRYFSKDIRVEEKTGEFSFDCKIYNQNIYPSLNWYNGNTEFTFNSEPVSIDIYVDRKFIFKLSGKNLGTYEGVIDINEQEFKEFLYRILVGNVLELFIYNDARKIEEHLIISVKHFDPETSIFACFKFLNPVP